MDTMKKIQRPWWMTPFGREPMGDVFMDRLWFEWPRDILIEKTADENFAKDGKS